ncbi:MAG: hypothetical protein KC636_21810, partial [Myxococcales bacterium]|nr:hypothetical protein [Myxococcales bacterium]
YLQRGKIRLRKQIYVDRETTDAWSPGMDDLDSVKMYAPHHRSLLTDAWIFRRGVLAALGRPLTDYPMEADEAFAFLTDDQRANLAHQRALVSFFRGARSHDRATLQSAATQLESALEVFVRKDDLASARHALAQVLLLLGTVELGDQNADEANRLFDEGLTHIDAAATYWKQEANLSDLGAAYTTRAELLRQAADEARARREIDRMIDELDDAPAAQLSLLTAGITIHWDDGRGLGLARKAMALVEGPEFPVDHLDRLQLYLYAVGVALRDDAATADELAGWSQKLTRWIDWYPDELQDVQIALARSYRGQVALRVQNFLDARDQFTAARELPGCEHLQEDELRELLVGLRDAYLGLDDPASAEGLRQPINRTNDPNRTDTAGLCLGRAS